MGRFDDLAGLAKFSRLRRIGASSVDEIRQEHPGVPDDFTGFLSEVGAGKVGDSTLMLYERLVSPHEIYGPEAAEPLRDVVVFGDDFQGYCIGFETNGWTVVEVNPNDWSVAPLAERFEEFIRSVAGQV